MIRRITASQSRRRGAVAVVVALCMIPLIGVLAFAIDGGLMLAARRRAQTVADAAAHAAACQLYSNLLSDLTGLDVSGKARAAALANASANGFNNDGSTNTVTHRVPPQTGDFAGKPGHAEVTVTYTQARIFGAIFGAGTTRLTARAVARGINSSSKPYSNASVILLDQSAAGSFSVSGSGNITTESTIHVNSSNAAAARATQAGYARASSIQVVGNSTTDASGRFYTTTDSAVRTAAPVLPDPLASLAPPSTTGLNPQLFISTYGTRTINPGVYLGGLSIGSGMTVTMNPGVYYMKSGSLTVGGGVTLKGTGVTIYMEDGNGQFNIQGGATVNLTPPTSGTYAGLTYFQDRGNNRAPSFGNGANITLSGTIYAPAAAVEISGGSSNKYGSQLIAKTMSISNGASLKVNTTTDAKLGYVASGAGGPSITLVE